MAKSPTTHVIEIETGIGEPAFIPLTLGQELQPISVGKKGMWRIESPRVLDVHAFIYFDGTSLFLQSADDEAPATVDGYHVGTAWTELHAPCAIEIGAARLRLRSMRPPAGADQTATALHRRPPVQATAPGEEPPTPRPAAGAPPEDPATPPKAERPFKPGAFSRSVDVDESTRFAPLESTGGRSALGGGARLTASRSIEAESGVRAGYAGPNALSDVTVGMPNRPVFPMGPAPGTSYPPGMPPGHPGMAMPPAPMHSGATPYLPYPGASGPYNVPVAAPSGGYGTMTSGQVHATPGLLAKYKNLSPPRRILIILAPFCLIAAAYLLLDDDERTPPVAALEDTSTAATTTTEAASSAPLAPPAPVPPACPPGFVPYSVAIQGQIPCVPADTPMPAASTAPAASDGADEATPPPSAPIAVAKGKTLERQAVDYVAIGDYAAAAQIYEQLQEQNPNNPVYPEAVRILRAKRDSGRP